MSPRAWPLTWSARSVKPRSWTVPDQRTGFHGGMGWEVRSRRGPWNPGRTTSLFAILKQPGESKPNRCLSNPHLNMKNTQTTENGRIRSRRSRPTRRRRLATQSEEVSRRRPGAVLPAPCEQLCQEPTKKTKHSQPKPKIGAFAKENKRDAYCIILSYPSAALLVYEPISENKAHSTSYCKRCTCCHTCGKWR